MRPDGWRSVASPGRRHPLAFSQPPVSTDRLGKGERRWTPVRARVFAHSRPAFPSAPRMGLCNQPTVALLRRARGSMLTGSRGRKRRLLDGFLRASIRRGLHARRSDSNIRSWPITSVCARTQMEWPFALSESSDGPAVNPAPRLLRWVACLQRQLVPIQVVPILFDSKGPYDIIVLVHHLIGIAAQPSRPE